jgi:hypothetical protein
LALAVSERVLAAGTVFGLRWPGVNKVAAQES